jgi:hypothetical protein
VATAADFALSTSVKVDDTVLAESKDLLTAAIEVHQLVTIVQLLCLLQLIIQLLQLIRVEQAFPLGGRPGFPLFHSSLTFVPSKNTFIDPN